MNKLILLALLLVGSAHADPIYFPNTKTNATGTLVNNKSVLDVNVAMDGTTQFGGSSYAPGDGGGVTFAVRKDTQGPLSGVADGQYGPLQTDANGNLKVAASLAEEAVAAPGDPIPATVKVVAGTDGTDTRTLKTNTDGELQVDVLSSALPADAATETTLSAINAKTYTVDTDDVIVTSSVLPTGAATETTLSSLDGKVTAVDTDDVTVTSSVLPTGASTETTLSALNTKVPSNLTVSSTRLLVDGSGVTQPVSASSLPLPTGAATEATLTTVDSSLVSIDGKISSDFGSSTDAIRTSAQLGNASGAADFGAGNASAQTIRTVIASDQGGIPVLTAANENADFDDDATVGAGAETFTAPVGAVGFILQASSSNVGNIRWKIGGTATASSGMILEPGRDTGYIPAGVDISYINASTTGDYLSVTWVIP